MQKEMKPILNNIVKSVDKVLEWQRKTQNKVNLFYSNLMYVLYTIADNQVSHCSLVFSTYMNLGRNIFSIQLNNIHKKFLSSDWLRAVQCFRNTVPKNEIHQWRKKKYSGNFLIFYFSNLLIFLISKCDL
jgi:hypothetical protein